MLLLKVKSILHLVKKHQRYISLNYWSK